MSGRHRFIARDCRAAEIQRIAENAPRWADVSKSIAPCAVIARSMHSVRAVVARANWRGFLSPGLLRSGWNNRSCGEFRCWTAPMHPPGESGPDGEPRRASGSRGSVFLRQSELTIGCARQAGGHRHRLWPGAVGQPGFSSRLAARKAERRIALAFSHQAARSLTTGKPRSSAQHVVKRHFASSSPLTPARQSVSVDGTGPAAPLKPG
jgi:hypothetical protein